MSSMDQPHISVRWIGEEREPVVMIENLAPDPDALREIATTLNFAEIGTYYPGVRAATTPAYFQTVGATVFQVIREFFGYTKSAEVLRSYYSLVTAAPQSLMVAQSIPHTDAYDDSQIAVIHYLSRKHQDGTAFFRHRSTGFETVNEARCEAYEQALASDFTRVGEPQPAYVGNDSPFFERIHDHPATFNGALIYRGKLLHCASVSQPNLLSEAPTIGRLTVASFIAAR